MNVNKFEIPFPYTDWSKIRALGRDCENYNNGVTVRIRACFDLPSVAGMPDNPPSKYPFLSLRDVRTLVAIRLIQTIDKQFGPGCNLKIAEETGYNNTLISKTIKFIREMEVPEKELTPDGEERLVIKMPTTVQPRPFSAPTVCFQRVADYVFNTTVHDMFFGEKARIVLPGIYSVAADRLETLPKEKIAELRVVGDTYRKDELSDAEEIRIGNTVFNRYGIARNSIDVLRERVKEVAYNNPWTRELLRCVGSDDTDADIRFKSFITDIFTEENGKDHDPGAEFLMFLSLETGQAMDYFTRADYVFIGAGEKKNLVAIYKSIDGKETLVTDPNVLKIISHCVALGGEYKKKYLTKLYTEMMRQDILSANDE